MELRIARRGLERALKGLGPPALAGRDVSYAGLMYDDYPPFRLDLGAADPVAVRSVQR
jgi:hypothetical protein